MPDLPIITSAKIIKILKSKGFVLDRIKGSHHIYYQPETKTRVVIPFHKRDLPKGTCLAILKSAGIDKEELKELI
ncbi:MAG: type II toxin-antitoxin system HicA family toxin [Actinobacteria bacterium]|nr:type II toxin-antitoxin system HicA family toxin [Actinomycetota bacterium]